MVGNTGFEETTAAERRRKYSSPEISAPSIEAGAEHGFSYPNDRTKLRLCRGYLKALPGLHKHLWTNQSSLSETPEEKCPIND